MITRGHGGGVDESGPTVRAARRLNKRFGAYAMVAAQMVTSLRLTAVASLSCFLFDFFFLSITRFVSR